MAIKKQVYKIGDTIKFKDATYISYGFKAGSTAKVVFANASQVNVISPITSQQVGVNFIYIEKAAFSKEEIENEIQEAEQIIKDGKAEIKWMKETKSDVFDEDEFKVWQVLMTLDNDSSMVDKSRAIAKLIKQ